MKTKINLSDQEARLCEEGKEVSPVEGAEMIKQCKICGKDFEVWLWQIKRGRGKFCSTKCFGLSIRRRVKGKCKTCGKEFENVPSKMSGKRGQYCSKKCLGVSTRGKNHPFWNGGTKRVRKRAEDKLKHNLKHNLNKRIKSLIKTTLKTGVKNNRHWIDLVGYDAKQLKTRLESTMPSGYTWQDFLDGNLHIDHIIPKSAFNYDKPEHIDFKRCWALDNLQLLPAKENFKKWAHIKQDFQPSLKI